MHDNEREHLHEVPQGYGENFGKDKAERPAVFEEHTLLVVFDCPTEARKDGGNAVLADLVEVKR